MFHRPDTPAVELYYCFALLSRCLSLSLSLSWVLVLRFRVHFRLLCMKFNRTETLLLTFLFFLKTFLLRINPIVFFFIITKNTLQAELLIFFFLFQHGFVACMISDLEGFSQKKINNIK